MSARKIVVIDTETGGTDCEKDAVMSIGLAVLYGGVDGTLAITVNDPEGENTAEALSIHGISTEYAREFGASPGAAVDRIEDFLLEHDLRDPRKVTLGGCQTAFDYGFLKRLYRLAGKEELFGKRYDRRLFDISPVALALEQAGRLDLRGEAPSLENIARSLGVPLPRQEFHIAVNDAVATARVMNQMFALLRYTGD